MKHLILSFYLISVVQVHISEELKVQFTQIKIKYFSQ